MTFVRYYETADGFDDLAMESDGEALTALRFAGAQEGRGGGGPAGEIPVRADASK